MPEPIQPASTKVLNTEFKLGFDPAKPDDPVIKEIFASQSARALWLFVRRDHLASQHFNADVLTAARRFDKLQPATLREFHEIFGGLTDGAVRRPWACDWRETDPNKHAERDAKLSFLMDAMYGKIAVTITINAQ